MKTLARGGEQEILKPTLCDACVAIQSCCVQRTQEMHRVVLHAVCEYMDQQIIAAMPYRSMF